MLSRWALIATLLTGCGGPSAGHHSDLGEENGPAPDGATIDSGDAAVSQPSAPTNLSATQVSSQLVSLAWTGVGASYRVLRDGTQVGTTLDENYSDTTVQPSTKYSFTVVALDAQGVASAPSAALAVTTPASLPIGNSPYPASDYTLTWDFKNRVYDQNGSDLWPVTWAADGEAHVAWGDGGGFGGSNTLGRTSLGFATVSGAPPNITTVNDWGGYEAQHAATFGGKIDSLLAVGNVIYGIGAVFPGAAGTTQSGGGDEMRLVYSNDNGASWSYASWTFCTQNAAALCPGGFIQFGQAYANARDGFVYAYATPGWWTDTAYDSSYLARVPKDEVLTQTSWTYFTGLDSSGTDTWGAASAAAPVFTNKDPDGGLVGEATYNPVLKRYIGTAQGPGIGQTEFFDSPNPWGPWTTLSYDTNWGSFGSGDTLGVHFCNKWTSTDGLTMWAAFSSVGDLDAFNLAQATFAKR